MLIVFSLPSYWASSYLVFPPPWSFLQHCFASTRSTSYLVLPPTRSSLLLSLLLVLPHTQFFSSTYFLLVLSLSPTMSVSQLVLFLICLLSTVLLSARFHLDSTHLIIFCSSYSILTFVCKPFDGPFLPYLLNRNKVNQEFVLRICVYLPTWNVALLLLLLT